MIEPTIDEPPSGSRIVVERLGDGIRLIMPVSDFRRNAIALTLGLACSGWSAYIFTWVLSPLSDSGWPCCAILFPGIFLTLLIMAIGAPTRRAVFTVTADGLKVEIKDVLGCRRWSWIRQQLSWIAPWQGLRIVTDNGPCTLLTKENIEKLAWVATALCEALQLKREFVAEPGELEVTFLTHPLASVEQRGFLSSRPGRMTLRYDFLGEHQYDFFNGGNEVTSWPMSRAQAFGLWPEDVQCTFTEDGAACMRVVLSSWPKLWLRVDCEDKDALHHALARFWGAKE
jgi:hypothetical protein